jgi:hypothetical protein
MNESEFYRCLKKTCSDLFLFRVETVQKDGFPDIAYVNKRSLSQGLMELKAVLRLPKTIKATGLTVEQNLFHYGWSQEGGVSYVLCWVELEQCALLWEGSEIFPAWRRGDTGVYQTIPKAALGYLSHYIR